MSPSRSGTDFSSPSQGQGSSGTEAFLSADTRLYLRDVLDHLVSSIQKVDMCRDILNQAHQNYLARVSIAVAESANETNERMKRLSILATSILPLTVVTSAFGMNVKVPFGEEDTVGPFFGIIFVTLALSLGVTAIYGFISNRK
jgi:Mg2+ and Co2+ transporter CorA